MDGWGGKIGRQMVRQTENHVLLGGRTCSWMDGWMDGQRIWNT